MNFESYTSKMLDVSTGMVPRATAVALGEGGDISGAELFAKLSYVPYHEYGWIIYVSSDAIAVALEAGHKELAMLLELAQANGFNFLRLDCDAEYLPEEVGLPHFNW